MKSWVNNRFFRRWHFFIAMYLLWMLFNFQWDLWTWTLGFLVSVGMTLFTSFVLYDETKFQTHMLSPWQLLVYVANLMKEIFLAAISYIKVILGGQYDLLVFDMQLHEQDPIKVALIANSITLTPGTVSLDVNGSTLTVMAVVKKGTTPAEVEAPIHAEFERRLQGKIKR